MERKVDLQRASNNKIVKANSLLRARYSLSIRELKLLLIIISCLSPDDEDFPTIHLKVSQIAQLLGLQKGALYKELKALLKQLLSRVVEVKTPNGYKLYHWVDTAEYIEGRGEIIMKIHPDLKPYLLKLKEKFTMYQLKRILRLKSSYAIRLYELFKQHEGYRDLKIGIDELRDILKLGDKYPRPDSLKNRVIYPAIQEISEKTDLLVRVLTLKEQRKTTGFIFEIARRDTYAEDNLSATLQNQAEADSDCPF